MTETPKRRQPTPDTLRELFLKSGNRCAFPGCHANLMDQDGNFVGQLCHIEAAEMGGERFNEMMTNEERRALSNLMLMCYPHHRITNDTQKYTVGALRRMKITHEARSTGADPLLHVLLSKARWPALLGTGVIVGAGLDGVATSLASLFGGADTNQPEKSVPSFRHELIQRLRFAPRATVHSCSRDPFHIEIGEEIFGLFRSVGWTTGPIDESEMHRFLNSRFDFDSSMLLLFKVSKAAQLSNLQKAIGGFFDALGFVPAKQECSVGRMERDHPVRFHLAFVATNS